jgi:hypothetical protein
VGAALVLLAGTGTASGPPPANVGAAPAVPAPPDYCYGDEFYFAWEKPRDLNKAFACYRASEDWLMLAIMQLNGEATPVDLAAARASLSHVESKDGDYDALDRIIAKREAKPTAKVERVDFCRDVATTTNSTNVCQAREESKKDAKVDRDVATIRSSLDARLRPTFDRVSAAYKKLANADGDRVYQEYVDGSIRNQEAMDQEARVRRNFLATIKRLSAGPAERLVSRRPFAEADKELNTVYRENLSSYVEFNQSAAADAAKENNAEMAAEYRSRVSDYKTKSHAAQREWVAYREAMSDLAAARWPAVRDARERARTLVTEDRIRELREK